MLLDPAPSDLEHTLAELRGHARRSRPDQRRELVLYYSGHSDEEGLRLGRELLPYARLRQQLTESGVEVRIAILDSCSAGAFTRSKGGKSRPAFLADTSSQVRGQAILASSSANEAAQESDGIEASFFTHFLVTGLRGAADVDRDRRVTLNEAYRFAFEETLARTEKTRSGPQHAAYDIQLAGTGDVVLTDLRGTRSVMTLQADVAGRVFVRDASRRLVAELQKHAGRPIALGLDPGDYDIIVDTPEQSTTAHLRLESGKSTTLAAAVLVPVSREYTLARGPDRRGPGSDDDGVPLEPIRLSIWPGLPSEPAGRQRSYASLGLLVGSASQLDGLGMGVVGHVAQERLRGMQIAPLNVARGRSAGLQIGALLNAAPEHLSGIQATPLINYAGSLRGAQVSPLLNWSEGNARGVQLSLFGNFTWGRFAGLQFAGWPLASAALLETWWDGNLSNLPLIVSANYAHDLRGLQMGGANLSDTSRGVQFGALNVAREVKGLQLGFANVAMRCPGAMLGLLSICAEGRFDLELGMHLPLGNEKPLRSSDLDDALGTDRPWVGVTARVGTRTVHNVFVLTAQPATDPNVAFGFGLGGHVALPRRLFLEPEFVFHPNVLRESLSSQKNDLSTLRCNIGWTVASPLSLVAGPTLNLTTGHEETWWPGFAFALRASVLAP